MKVINTNTPWGQYRIPAWTVANDRASYYAENQTEYNEEFDFTLKSDYYLIDWLLNNMDWENFEGVAEKFSDRILVTEDDFWTDSDDFEVVEQ